MNSIKISNNQILLLLITLVSATAVLFVPAITAREAQQNGWLSILGPATLYGLAVVWVTCTLALRFPGQTFGKYLRTVLGKPLGSIVGLMYVFFLLHSTMAIIREFGEFLNTSFMPETPIQVFNLTLILLSSYAVYHGIEVICRMNQWLFPLLLSSFFFIVLLVLPEARVSNLLPVMAEGFYPVLKASFTPAVFRGEVFLLLFLIPYAREPKKTKVYAGAAVVLTGIILTLDAAVHTMVLGSELSSKLTFPTLLLSEYVMIGNFLSRLEALVMLIWVSGVVAKVSLFYFAAVICLQDSLNVKSYRWQIIPVSAALYLGAQLVFKNLPELSRFLTVIFPPLAALFELLIPLLILSISWLRKIGGSSK